VTDLFTAGMTVDNGPDSVCRYIVASSLPNPGAFLAQITATCPRKSYAGPA